MNRVWRGAVLGAILLMLALLVLGFPAAGEDSGAPFTYRGLFTLALLLAPFGALIGAIIGAIVHYRSRP